MRKKIIKWCKAAGMRSIKTMAQTAVAMIGTAAVVNSVDWNLVISASLLSGILSLLIRHQTKWLERKNVYKNRHRTKTGWKHI